MRAFGDAVGWTLATVAPPAREAFCSRWAISRSRLANFFSNHKPRGHCVPNPDALRDASDLSVLPGLIGADASPDDDASPTHPTAPESVGGGDAGHAAAAADVGGASTATASEGGVKRERGATPGGDASPSSPAAGVPSPSTGDGGSTRRRKLAPQAAAFE